MGAIRQLHCRISTSNLYYLKKLGAADFLKWWETRCTGIARCPWRWPHGSFTRSSVTALLISGSQQQLEHLERRTKKETKVLITNPLPSSNELSLWNYFGNSLYHMRPALFPTVPRLCYNSLFGYTANWRKSGWGQCILTEQQRQNKFKKRCRDKQIAIGGTRFQV